MSATLNFSLNIAIGGWMNLVQTLIELDIKRLP